MTPPGAGHPGELSHVARVVRHVLDDVGRGDDVHRPVRERDPAVLGDEHAVAALTRTLAPVRGDLEPGQVPGVAHLRPDRVEQPALAAAHVDQRAALDQRERGAQQHRHVELVVDLRVEGGVLVPVVGGVHRQFLRLGLPADCWEPYRRGTESGFGHVTG
jgi:hypothetical protein